MFNFTHQKNKKNCMQIKILCSTHTKKRKKNCMQIKLLCSTHTPKKENKIICKSNYYVQHTPKKRIKSYANKIIMFNTHQKYPPFTPQKL
jgi:hypothetical protein